MPSFDDIWSDDPSLQLESAKYIRMLLSQLVLETGVVPRLVEFLRMDDFPQLQHEAAWALSILATAKPDVVVDHGIVPIFVKLLASREDSVREKAIWGLGNIADHSPDCSSVLGCGALTPLMHLLYEDTNLSILRNGTWTLFKLCHGPPPPFFHEVKPVLERLVHSNNDEVLYFACLALSNLSSGSEDGIQSVIEAGFVPRLVELLQHPTPFVLFAALFTIGAIVSGDDQQTQHVIDHGALPIIFNLFTRTFENDIHPVACRTIAYITAGTKEQIQSVIDANLIPTLVNLAKYAELKMKKEAQWAILNVTVGGSHDQINYMVEQSCIKPMCEMLVCPDPETILKCLDGLENILKAEETDKNTGHVNCYPQLIKDGLQKIENLQSHENREIQEKASEILGTYNLREEDEEVT